MVLLESIKATDEIPTKNEFKMESGHHILYVAPYKHANATKTDHNSNKFSKDLVRRKLNETDGNEEDKWEGVHELCQVLDNTVFAENDAAMFENKRVLELGFCTGLPSAFAFSQGASTVALHSADGNSLNLFVRATLWRNNVPRNCIKFSSGDYEACKRSLSAQKYDVILAPELIYTDETNFELIHDVLDAALAPHGIILFSARSYYADCSGSLPTFLDLVKLRGTFDAHTRWTSPKFDSSVRKIMQMNRAIR